MIQKYEKSWFYHSKILKITEKSTNLKKGGKNFLKPPPEEYFFQLKFFTDHEHALRILKNESKIWENDDFRVQISKNHWKIH